jgi:predicted metalloendopeptidase
MPHLLARTLYLSFTLGAALSLTACGGGRSSSQANPERSEGSPGAASATHAGLHGIDESAIDTSVVPGDDFFHYANGAWLKRTEIPADRSSYGVWSVLFDRAQQRTRDLLEKAASGSAPAGSDERKIGDYYATYLDEQTIESKGIGPLRDTLAAIDALADKGALATWVGQRLRADVDPLNMTNFYTDRLFGVWVAQNLNDPSHNVPYLLQGGLGLPDRDYYVEGGSRMERIHTAYRGHVASVLKLAGYRQARDARHRHLRSRTSHRHRARDAHRVGRRAQGEQSMDTRRVRTSRARTGLERLLCRRASRPRPHHHRLASGGDQGHRRARAIGPDGRVARLPEVPRARSIQPCSSKAFADESFAFYGKFLSGTPQDQERWKRAVNATNGALGEAVGKIYVQRYFPPEAKAQLQEMVAAIVAAFDRRLDALTWMSPATKANAKAKLASLKVGIGYPDRWRDYSKLEIVRGDAVGNAFRAGLFDYQLRLEELQRAPDRGQWWLEPQTVNAVNLPIQNALNFPAAILEPPFYDPQASTAARYGAIGASIGHEISHSFDDQGSQFDATGHLANWWTPEDTAHFKDASAKLVAQYNAYAPFPRSPRERTAHAQREHRRRCGAVGGVRRVSGDRRHRRSRVLPQLWPELADEGARGSRSPTGDDRRPRARSVPRRYGRNLDAWYAPFEVKPGQRLYLSPADRVRVW